MASNSVGNTWTCAVGDVDCSLLFYLSHPLWEFFSFDWSEPFFWGEGTVANGAIFTVETVGCFLAQTNQLL